MAPLCSLYMPQGVDATEERLPWGSMSTEERREEAVTALLNRRSTMLNKATEVSTPDSHDSDDNSAIGTDSDEEEPKAEEPQDAPDISSEMCANILRDIDAILQGAPLKPYATARAHIYVHAYHIPSAHVSVYTHVSQMRIFVYAYISDTSLGTRADGARKKASLQGDIFVYTHISQGHIFVCTQIHI